MRFNLTELTYIVIECSGLIVATVVVGGHILFEVHTACPKPKVPSLPAAVRVRKHSDTRSWARSAYGTRVSILLYKGSTNVRMYAYTCMAVCSTSRGGNSSMPLHKMTC